MRRLASGISAVLLPLGLLLGLGQTIHAARPDLGTATRPTPARQRLGRSSSIPSPRHSQRWRRALPAGAGGPALVVRVLTLDISDPWHPVPLTLRPPAWSEYSGRTSSRSATTAPCCGPTRKRSLCRARGRARTGYRSMTS